MEQERFGIMDKLAGADTYNDVVLPSNLDSQGLVFSYNSVRPQSKRAQLILTAANDFYSLTRSTTSTPWVLHGELRYP